jgi:hypothetical protein
MLADQVLLAAPDAARTAGVLVEVGVLDDDGTHVFELAGEVRQRRKELAAFVALVNFVAQEDDGRAATLVLVKEVVQ